ncbi:unnamed protein product [Ranitomeya imitator]|uniref:Uncharacterized protein n=1 Tax=Ranitomeya imitator TaxID=111125 RepID=A0ABN9M8S5_9NEOB|nr:unnamed protein product [Ranitomeya imitator]
MKQNVPETGLFAYTSEDGERIIREVETNATFLGTPSLHDLKLKYENTLKKSTTLQVHLITLSEYYKAKKIPRGLRSNIRPNLITNDSLFCARFRLCSHLAVSLCGFSRSGFDKSAGQNNCGSPCRFIAGLHVTVNAMETAADPQHQNRGGSAVKTAKCEYSLSMISNKYGLDIILLNIEYLQQELKKVDLDIPVMESEIKSLLREDEWTSFRELLKTKFDKLRLELEEVKRRKWNRDMEDYREGNIYNWQRETSGNWRKKVFFPKKKTLFAHMTVIFCNLTMTLSGLDSPKEKLKNTGKGEEKNTGDSKKEKKGKYKSPAEKQVATRSKDQV